MLSLVVSFTSSNHLYADYSHIMAPELSPKLHIYVSCHLQPLLFILCSYSHCIQSWVDCIPFPSCFSPSVPHHRKWKHQSCTSQLDIRNKASSSPLLFSSFHFQSIVKCCLSNLLITLKATCFLHLHCCWHKAQSSFTCKTAATFPCLHLFPPCFLQPILRCQARLCYI